MPAETARSSSSSAEPYVGELISLTSTSDIRYEGQLQEFSPENFNVSLRNVTCLGTEGRRRYGPQVAPDDRIFEYILFRGRNIKDMQVIPSASRYDDPAIIIQSHNPQVTTPLTSMSVGPRFIPNHSRPIQHSGQHWPTFPGNVPFHQSAGSLGSFFASSPLSTYNRGLITSMCRPGFHRYENSFQPHQQVMPQNPLDQSMPIMHSMVEYLISNGLYSGNSVLQHSQLLESSPRSLATNKYESMNFHSTMPPAPPASIPEPLKMLVPARSSAQPLPTAELGTTASLVSPLTNNFNSELSIPLPVSDESKLASTSYLASSSTSQSSSLAVERSSVLPNDPLNPSLVTPNQLCQPEFSSVSPSLALPSHPSTTVNEISSLDSKAPMFAAQQSSKISDTEESDFMAMNEKLKKDGSELQNRDTSLKDKNQKTFDKVPARMIGLGVVPTGSTHQLRIGDRGKSHELGVRRRGRG